MKKEIKTEQNKKLDVLRWVVLVPVLSIVWYMTVIVLGYVPQLMYMWGWFKVLEYFEMLLAVLGGFVLPCIAVYYTAKYIAPKYKKTVGWCAVGFCVLWTVFMLYGLAHMAY